MPVLLPSSSYNTSLFSYFFIILSCGKNKTPTPLLSHLSCLSAILSSSSAIHLLWLPNICSKPSNLTPAICFSLRTNLILFFSTAPLSPAFSLSSRFLFSFSSSHSKAGYPQGTRLSIQHCLPSHIISNTKDVVWHVFQQSREVCIILAIGMFSIGS